MAEGDACLHCIEAMQTRRPAPFGIGRRSFLSGLRPRRVARSRRLCGVELPVAFFDAASALVPGNRRADMIRASALARSGDFPLRLAGCQGKDLIVEARRAPPAASW